MTTTDEAGRDRAPAGKEGSVSEKMEWLRSLVAPAMLLALVTQGVNSVTTVKDISNTAQNATTAVAEVKGRVQALEANRETSTAEMAVVKSKVDSALKLLERIDARMEARSGRDGK